MTEALGVSVPVQLMPLLLLARPVTVPLPTVRSALVKPLTASLKVKVTVAVSPILSAVSLMSMLELSVGRTVSTA